MLLSEGFMSEVLTYREIALGDTEKYFLRLFSIFGEMSAFNIYLYLQKTEGETDHKSMAYVNVRKRILRLSELGLIEEIKEKHRYRNAIRYRLTSHGLFHRMLMMPEHFIFPLHLKPYKHSIILQTILYQFFEVETLDYFNTIVRAITLSQYLRHCCQSIIDDVESFRRSRVREKSKYMTTEHMAAIIEGAIKTLVFEIVLNSTTKYVEFSGIDRDGHEYVRTDLRKASQLSLPYDIDNEYVYPNLALAKDGKFIKILDEIKEQFDVGYKNFR